MSTHGKNTYFGLDNAGGSLQNISSWLKKVDNPLIVDKHDDTTFGNNSKTYAPGLKDSTISISGIWSPTVETHFTGLLGLAAATSFVSGPAGNTSGYARRLGECRLVNYKVGSQEGDIIPFDAELQITGDVTFDTF